MTTLRSVATHDPDFEGEIAAFYASQPDRVPKLFPYAHVDRAIEKETLPQNPDDESFDGYLRSIRFAQSSVIVRYKRSPIGLRWSSGFHRSVLEVVMDYWIGFTLGRRLECPCGRAALIEVFV